MTFEDLIPIYDFSQIPAAVQSFFCAPSLNGPFVAPPPESDPLREQWLPLLGNIAFMTTLEASLLQSPRPRVWVDDFAINEMRNFAIVDINGTPRCNAWAGKMRLGILTDASFQKHMALRSAILAIIPMLQPLATADGSGIASGGINALLQYHEVGQFSAVTMTPNITPAEDRYTSPIDVQITFSVRAGFWDTLTA